MKIINRKLISLLLLMTFMFLASAGFVYALTAPSGLTGLSTKTVSAIIKDITNWVVGIVAFVCAFVIVIAGIMWAMAGGDEDKQTKARKLLISGVIGLLIALAALALVKMVMTLL